MGGKKEIYQYIRFFHGALQFLHCCIQDLCIVFVQAQTPHLLLDTVPPSLPWTTSLVLFYQPSSLYSIWPNRHHPCVQHIQIILLSFLITKITGSSLPLHFFLKLNLKILQFLQRHMVVTSQALGMCERLAQGCYLATQWLGVEPATCWMQVQCLDHFITKPHLPSFEFKTTQTYSLQFCLTLHCVPFLHWPSLTAVYQTALHATGVVLYLLILMKSFYS